MLEYLLVRIFYPYILVFLRLHSIEFRSDIRQTDRRFGVRKRRESWYSDGYSFTRNRHWNLHSFSSLGRLNSYERKIKFFLSFVTLVYGPKNKNCSVICHHRGCWGAVPKLLGVKSRCNVKLAFVSVHCGPPNFCRPSRLTPTASP